MNTDALVYLLEIAETGSFNKAAQNLFISQPALRSTISKLEKDVGGSLLNRTKYGCTLTELGERVTEDAPVILNLLTTWQESARADAKDYELVIYATKPVCSTILLPVTTKLHEILPHIRFIIRSGNYAESLRMLRKAQCQLAIIHADLSDEETLREQLALEGSYTIEKIMENDFLALINVENPLSKKSELISTDLADSTFASISTLEMLTNTHFFKTGLNAKQSLFFDSHHSIYQAVNNNPHYYAILASIFATTEDYKLYPRIQFKPVADLNARSAFYMIFATASYSRDMQSIRDAIKEYCEHFSTTTYK